MAFRVGSLVLVMVLGWPAMAAAGPACPAVLDHRLPRLQDEKPVDLCQHAGKVVLVVNTASQCGYTPQYRGLETLFQRYASRGLVVLGFPSNDFEQEMSSNEAIADFCENQFAVRFPMFVRSAVTTGRAGSAVNPLFAALAARAGGPPRWNFHKYLVSRDGAVVLSRPSATDPLDPGFVREIERLLDQKMN